MALLRFVSLLLAVVGSAGMASAVDERQNVCLKLIEHHCGGAANPGVMEACLNDNILTCAKPTHCLQSSEVGMCRAAFRRFYHNVDTGKCEKFIYGGCGGNSNNYLTKDTCHWPR